MTTRLPVTVLSGFLVADKNTMFNHVLAMDLNRPVIESPLWDCLLTDSDLSEETT